MHVTDFLLVIPCYNNREGLLKTLNSIVYPPQRFAVVVVDDGSLVPLDIKDIRDYIPLGFTLEIIRSDTNQGVARSLNRALEACYSPDRYTYIARLDCGDVAVNDRFQKQVRFLDSQHEVVLLGSKVVFRSETTGKEYLYQCSSEHIAIKKEMHFRCSFIHPGVMFRGSILSDTGFYPENYLHCEDYAFFFKLVARYHTFILPEVLTICEINDSGISARNRKQQLWSRFRVVKDFGLNKGLILLGCIKLILLMLVPLSGIRYLNTRKK
jgi:glycosyltransferase involved in cell wall biosynthesis